ncbi:MAG: PhzF family phenazine biosynthesis protein, partial [Lentibacter algarum]|nr:PhzF family phenazine biosynthesis protein [Lentibacter algarum]
LARLSGAPVAFTVLQGSDMGRPSRIGLQARDGSVTIAGQAVKTMQGQLTLSPLPLAKSPELG